MMQNWLFGILATIVLISAVPLGAEAVKVAPTLPATGGNEHYFGNRPPLLGSPLIKLAPGDVRPEGWVRRQLELMADGFTGRLPELSEFCKFDGNAWVSPKGEGHHGWEEVPYWLKGYISLGYVLGDKQIINESKRWIEGLLSNQRPDGYFGPEVNRAQPDLWPNMPAMHALRTYFEATGDKRVPELMRRYFQWQTTVPLERLLPPFWQKVRGGDNLDSIYWLYNRMPEPWLLGAARVIHERTADWTGGIASWHGVNAGQAFREPAQFYQQTKDVRYLKAAVRNYDEIRHRYGQVPGGMFGADENARQSFYGPRQAAESCTMAEMMYSHELMCAITGDGVWADRCEEIAFNSLPASMTPDLKGLHYLTAPNQVQLDRANKAPMIQNGGDMFSYNPYGYRCCQHNMAMAWPYFAEHMWMASQGNGLAAVLYGPCSVKAKVGPGVIATITESTNYPFDEQVRLDVAVGKSVKFPLVLRVPGWCSGPKVAVNGKPMTVPVEAKGWLILDRTWKNGDRVDLTLPMGIEVTRWKNNRNTVSVNRGPLTYSLAIGEEWKRYGGTDEWPAFEVYPTNPWNYGLVIDDNAASFRVELLRGKLADQPFAPSAAPVKLIATGKRIPEWVQESNGMVGEVQQGPVISDQPEEQITLVPMGCARLRISAFPVIGTGPDARRWSDVSVTALASFATADSPMALDDGVIPGSSGEVFTPRFTWWDHVGTSEWVQYTFSRPVVISWVEVYWFDDAPTGGSCRIPQSWEIVYWDGNAWQPVKAASAYGTEKDRLNRVQFEAVETTQIRLNAQLRQGFSAGIHEWKYGN